MTRLISPVMHIDFWTVRQAILLVLSWRGSFLLLYILTWTVWQAILLVLSWRGSFLLLYISTWTVRQAILLVLSLRGSFLLLCVLTFGQLDRPFCWFCHDAAHFSCYTYWLGQLDRGARWLSGRVSDSGARGRGFETYRRRVVSLSKTLYSPKVLVNYPGSDGSVPTWLKNCWLGR